MTGDRESRIVFWCYVVVPTVILTLVIIIGLMQR